MKTATGLTAIAVGAVLAFAVNGHPGFLNLQVVGWIIMLLGAAGLVLPRRGYGWLRQRVVLRRPDGSVAGVRRRMAPAVMIDSAVSGGPGWITGAPEATVASQADVPPQAGVPVTEVPVDEVTQVIPGEEVVEEYLPE
jgi:hypothetical protein